MAAVMDIPGNFNFLCRTCAIVTVDGSRYNIFEGEGLLRSIPQKLKSLPVEVTQMDQLPKVMCEKCVYKLDLLYEFVEKMKNAESQLHELLNNHTTLIKVEPDICDFDEEHPMEKSDSFSMQHQESEFLCIKEEHRETSPADSNCKTQGKSHEQNTVSNTQMLVQNVANIPNQTVHKKQSFSIAQPQAISLNPGGGTVQVNQNVQKPTVQNIYRCMYCQLLLPSLEASASHIMQVHNLNKQPTKSFASLPPEVYKSHSSLKPLLPRLPPLVYTKTASQAAQIPKPATSSFLSPSVSPSTSANKSLNRKKTLVTNEVSKLPVGQSFTSMIQKSAPPILPPLLITNLKNYSAAIVKSKQNDLLPSTASKISEIRSKRSSKKMAANANSKAGKVSQTSNQIKKSVSESTSKKESKIRNKINYESKSFRHECNFCYISFPSEEGCNLHLEKHHMKEYECKFCKFRFNSKDGLTNHVLQNKGPHILPPHRGWKCSECGKEYPDRYKIRAHLRKHSGERPFACRFCPKAFIAKATLQMHERIHNKDWSEICSYCGKGFYYKEHLNTHVRSKHTFEKPFKCDKCEVCFANKIFLKFHILKVHEDGPYASKIYECEICLKRFNGPNGLYCHRRIHSGSLDERRIHKCLVCDVAFVTKKYLKQHMKIHTGENIEKYECHLCGKKLTTSRGLELHLLIHSGVKNFICDFCGKAFASIGNLKTHVRSHTGEKPHQCRICYKNFTQRTSLIMHLKNIHDIDDRVRKLKKF